MIEALQVVALETERRLATLETEMESVMSDIKEIKKMVSLLVDTSNKYKGFWAGAIAAGTALGTAIGALLSYIFHYKISG